MLRINITEFRKNIHHYIELSQKEDIEITKHGVPVAVLRNPDKYYEDSLFNLCGCLKKYDEGKDYKDIIEEGILEKCGFSK